MRHRPQKAAEIIPERESGGGFLGSDPQHQQQQQHSLAHNVHQWATAAAMNRKSLDDVDLALSAKQQQMGGYYRVPMGAGGQMQMVSSEEAAYYYSRAGGVMQSNNSSSSGSGGGTLPRNFGGLMKEEKVRPVAKVQAQVVMRNAGPVQVPSPPLKDPTGYVMAQQQQQQIANQPVYVNFGHLSNHVHHHHFYGGDVNTNTIALTALQQQQPVTNSSAIVVNTQAEVHHHVVDTPATVVAMQQAAAVAAAAVHHKNDIKVSDMEGVVREHP